MATKDLDIGDKMKYTLVMSGDERHYVVRALEVYYAQIMRAAMKETGSIKELRLQDGVNVNGICFAVKQLKGVV